MKPDGFQDQGIEFQFKYMVILGKKKKPQNILLEYRSGDILCILLSPEEIAKACIKIV